MQGNDACRWYEATKALLVKLSGKTAVEVTRGSSISDASGAGPGHVYTISVDDGNGSPSPVDAVTRHATVREDPLSFLRSFGQTIDLLHLDAWGIGTAGYKERHLELYRAARDKLSPQALVLIGDTHLDYGGKGTLVIPEAMADGLQILLWGPLTLLGRLCPSDVHNVLPQLGLPLPSESSFDEAVRRHREGLQWEAGILYQDILRQWPDHVGALHLLGVVRHQRGDHEEALRLIGRAIALDPTRAVHFSNYGAALQALGRHVEALTCFHHALTIRPKFGDALANLGAAQEALGQDDAAIESLRRALDQQPGHIDALKRLGSLLQQRGQELEAIRLYELSCQKETSPELCVNFGNLLLASRRPDLAVSKYEKALELEPNNPAAHFNLGAAQQQLQMVEQSREHFTRAADLHPGRPFWRLRPAIISPGVFSSREKIDAYRERLARTLDSWCAAPRPPVHWNELMGADAIPNLSMSYHGCNNRTLKEKFAAVYAPYFRDVPEPKGSGVRNRPRIGILVTQAHEGIFLRCMRSVLEQLSPKDFELVILCSNGIVESLRKGIRRELRFVPFPATLAEAAARIRAAACDVIHYWEIGSDSLNYFLPFARLAPVQTTSWGSQITSGVPAVDWFLSSHLIESEGSEDQYTERLWKSSTLFIKDERLPAVSPESRDHFRLPENRNLYVCFQNPMKLHPDTDPLFRGILEADPKATIVLLAGAYGQMAALLKERFRQTIPAGHERIVFLPWQKFDDYCRLLQLADVALDPPHYSAGSTAYDLLSFNQPTVTLPGQLAVGRVTYGLYTKMGIEDLIASSPEQYVEIAVRVANDRDYRRSLRSRIHGAGQAIFDDRMVVAEHERFFAEVASTAIRRN